MKTSVATPVEAGPRLRDVRVGDLLPRRLLLCGERPIEASALLVPGRGDLGAYVAALDAAAPEFAEWDGRASVLPADGALDHRLVIADRYGQVFAALDADDAAALPDAAALGEWFKFLATACPECGVLDDPTTERDWVP